MVFKKKYRAFICTIFILAFSCFFISCDETKHIKATEIVLPSCGCDKIWEKPAAKELVETLVASTKDHYPVWPGYHFGDGAIVLNAGKNDKGQHCLGIWQHGKAISYSCQEQTLKMLTPLYSYYLDYKNVTAKPDSIFLQTDDQAPAFTQWMKENNIEVAVYMPVEFPDFPFTIPTKTIVQLALHESFHLEVQLRYWFTGRGNWPAWDKQPDRPGVQTCYIKNDTVKDLIQKELASLADAVTALIDKDKEKVCTYGNQFLEQRRKRYALLKNVTINQKDNTPCNCETAETLMETEEGITDYASWTKMYELGIVDRETLLKRYRAKQNDHYYLTGAMLLHAVSLMDPINIDKEINSIIHSESPAEGSLTSLFKKKLEQYCKQ